jgi:hypothetical protein
MALTTALGAGAVQVQYDGRTPWGAAPPYVSIDREPIFYGGKWGQVAKITLTGEISQYAYLYDLIKMGACDPTVPASPGCFFTDGSPFEITLEYPKGLKNLEKIRDDIIETFSNSLRTFEFEDTQVPPNKMEFDNVIVESVDFPPSGYWGLLNYSISLKCYEQDYFMAQGIVDAVDEFQTTENENGTLSVSHRISARGVDYTDEAGVRQHGLSNAITWVDSRKGTQYKSEEGIYKAWWGGTGVEGDMAVEPFGPTQENEDVGAVWLATSEPVKAIKLILLNQDESINRLIGTYAVSESFIGYLDIDNNRSGLPFGRKFSVNINESLTSDFNVVTVTGEYVGGKDTTLKELRDGFVKDGWTDTSVSPPVFHPNEPETMLFEKAKELSGFDGSLLKPPHPDAGKYHKPLLYNIPMGFTVEESETDKTINIKATFDTNPLFVDDAGNPTRHFFNHKISVKMDELTNVATVSIDGQLQIRGLAAEKQFYLKEFLENLDVMDFLWKKADHQHAKIGNTCWECTGGKYPTGHSLVGQPVYGTGNYWIRADIGDLYDEAKDICSNHPYAGSLPAGATPDRCHDLNRSAKSLSIVQNTAKNTAALTASFSDEDTLPIELQNPDDGTCFQCEVMGNNSDLGILGDLVAVVFVSLPLPPNPIDAATLLCPDSYDAATNPSGTQAVACPASGINTLSPSPLLDTGKDYGRAGFNIDVTSPVDYAKTNASAQAKYNGHWAIQKFGIKTREKSNVKVDLQFREDAGVPQRLMEPVLRKQAKDIQETLNSMLDQGGGAAQGVSPVYDIAERVTHKESKGDKVGHALQRSYAPDADHTICVDIDPIGDQKNCFVCVDANGVIAVSPTMGDKVYAYPENSVTTTPATGATPAASATVAQQLCDQLGLSIGIDPSDPSTGLPLTPGDCGYCYKCIDGYEVIHSEVYAESIEEAQVKCGGGAIGVTTTSGGVTTTSDPMRYQLAWSCDDRPPSICYQCIHQGPDSGGTVPPPTILYPAAGGFNTFDPFFATDICVHESNGGASFTFDTSDAEYMVQECPELVNTCWTCYFMGETFGFVMATDETDAKNECSLITGVPPVIASSDLFLQVWNYCDFDDLSTTAPPTTTAPTPRYSP